MQIITTPDPRLRQKSTLVNVIDASLRSQIEEMFVLLKKSKDPQGVGLAAPQVGLNQRFFIILDQGKRQILINPVITNKSPKMISEVVKDDEDLWYEGCLSIPKIWGFVDRPFEIEVTYQDLDFKKHTQKFIGVESAYAQHEIDHLDGILFTDLILKQGGEILHETARGLVPLDLIPKT